MSNAEPLRNARAYQDTKRLLALTATDDRSEDAVEEIVSILQRKAPKLLDGLTDNNKQQVARRCRTKLFGFDEVVFRQGDAPDAYYTVIRGAVSIYALNPSSSSGVGSSQGRGKFGRFLTQLPPGESFGELSFNGDGRHSRRNAGVVSDGCHGEARFAGKQSAPSAAIGDEASDACVLLLIPEPCYMSEMFARHSAKHQTKDKIHLLQSSSLFKHWTMDQLVRLAYAMKKKSFERGAALVQQGERMEHLWIVRRGGVRVSHTVVPPTKGAVSSRKQPRESITVDIADLGPGDMVGLVESAEESVRKSQREVVALAATETFFLPLSFFKSLLAQDATTRALVEKVVDRRHKWEALRRDYAAKFPRMSMKLPKEAASMSHYALDGCDVAPGRLSVTTRKRDSTGQSTKEPPPGGDVGSPGGRRRRPADGLLRRNRGNTLDGLFDALSCAS